MLQSTGVDAHVPTLSDLIQGLAAFAGGAPSS